MITFFNQIAAMLYAYLQGNINRVSRRQSVACQNFAGLLI
jgi:hypothetical protein